MHRHFMKVAAAAAFMTGAASISASACEVRVTTWGGNYHKTYESVAPEFEKQYNCEVKWVVANTNEFMVKARLGQVDVATNNIVNSLLGEKEGLWMELDPEKIPNMKNAYGNALYSPYTVFINVGDYALAYNSKHVTEEPTSWDVLWDPKYKGRVMMYGLDSPSTLGIAIQQATKHGGGIDNIEPGLKRLAELESSGNLIGFLGVESQMVSLMELEEAWLGVLATGRIKDLWDKGADFIKIARPVEGTVPVITTANIVKTATDPEMAMNFVNFMLGKTSQEAFALRNLYAPTVKNAVIPEDFKYAPLFVRGEAFERLYNYDLDKVNEVKASWLEMYERMEK